MSILKQSTARSRMIWMCDSTDHVSGKAGLTLTITASKNGAAFASITPTVNDRGNGWYELQLDTTMTNTLGDLALHITATGADPTDLVDQVCLDLPGTGAITTADKESIADTIMARDSSNWETAALAGSKRNLGTAVMAAMHKHEDDGAGNIKTYKTDNATTAFTQAIVPDATLDPIKSVAGA